MNKPIINIAEVELLPPPSGMAPSGDAATRYAARMARISPQLGAQKLGYNITMARVFQPTDCGKLHRVAKYFLHEGDAHVS